MLQELQLDLISLLLTLAIVGLIYLRIRLREIFHRPEPEPLHWTLDRRDEAYARFGSMANGFVSALEYCQAHLDDARVMMRFDRAETRLVQALRHFRLGDAEAADAKFHEAEYQLGQARLEAAR